MPRPICSSSFLHLKFIRALDHRYFIILPLTYRRAIGNRLHVSFVTVTQRNHGSLCSHKLEDGRDGAFDSGILDAMGSIPIPLDKFSDCGKTASGRRA